MDETRLPSLEEHLHTLKRGDERDLQAVIVEGDSMVSMFPFLQGDTDDELGYDWTVFDVSDPDRPREVDTGVYWGFDWTPTGFLDCYHDVMPEGVAGGNPVVIAAWACSMHDDEYFWSDVYSCAEPLGRADDAQARAYVCALIALAKAESRPCPAPVRGVAANTPDAMRDMAKTALGNGHTLGKQAAETGPRHHGTMQGR